MNWNFLFCFVAKKRKFFPIYFVWPIKKKEESTKKKDGNWNIKFNDNFSKMFFKSGNKRKTETSNYFHTPTLTYTQPGSETSIFYSVKKTKNGNLFFFSTLFFACSFFVVVVVAIYIPESCFFSTWKKWNIFLWMLFDVIIFFCCCCCRSLNTVIDDANLDEEKKMHFT